MWGVLDIPLKYLVQDRDRHGNVRRYVRIPGRRKVRLHKDPDTQEFIDEYQLAISGAPLGQTSGVGSFRWLCVQFYASGRFRRWDASTQGWLRRSLDGIAAKHGHKPVRLMRPRHVRKIIEEIQDTPAAANLRLKAMRWMFKWAIADEHMDFNPTREVERIDYVEQGHETASAEQIEQYKARHPLGTKARLAFDLLRYTTGRREDIPLLGPGHVKDGRIAFRQQKNKDRKPVDVDMPVHPELEASIAACPSGHMTFLVTAFGKPYSTNGFGNKMRQWFDQADLPDLSAHSMRKATPAQMAENEATPHEIMAVTGHQTLKMVEVYTKGAERKRLATSGMKKVK